MGMRMGVPEIAREQVVEVIAMVAHLAVDFVEAIGALSRSLGRISGLAGLPRQHARRGIVASRIPSCLTADSVDTPSERIRMNDLRSNSSTFATSNSPFSAAKLTYAAAEFTRSTPKLPSSAAIIAAALTP